MHIIAKRADIYRQKGVSKMPTYELTDESKEKDINGITYVVYRIRAKADRPILGVRKGDLGDFVENGDNLLHNSAGWVGDNAVVCGGARVLERALVSGDSLVFGAASIWGDACIKGKTRISGGVTICGNVIVGDNATISVPITLDGELQIGSSYMIYAK